MGLGGGVDNRGRFVGYWGRGVDNGSWSIYCGCWSVDSMGGCWFICRFISILSLARVRDISNIATVGISNSVGNYLNATIWQVNTVRARGQGSFTLLSSLKVCASVVILHCILVIIDWWLIIGGRSSITKANICCSQSKGAKEKKNLE